MKGAPKKRVSSVYGRREDGKKIHPDILAYNEGRGSREKAIAAAKAMHERDMNAEISPSKTKSRSRK